MASRQLTLLPDPVQGDRSPTKRIRAQSASGTVRVSAEMELGRAGEYLVLADLLLRGWVAYPTS